MLTNNEIKLINSLQKKKERIKNGLFIVEGVKMVKELLQSNYEIACIYATQEFESTDDKIEIISDQQLSKISQFTTPNQVLALAKIPTSTKIDANSTSLILDGINDPGNLGTIIRTADWFGINQIICSNGSTDCFSPKTVSATMGSIFRTSVYYTDIEEFIKQSNLPSVGAFLEGTPLNESQFTPNCNLIFGSESHGISDSLKSKIEHHVTILGAGTAESLNLSIAVGIFCNNYYQSSK